MQKRISLLCVSVSLWPILFASISRAQDDVANVPCQDLRVAGNDQQRYFLIGADQFVDFLTWKDPEGVLALARVGVATRPGYPRERVDAVLQELSRPDRVELFEIEPVPISSREIRDRVRRGESIDGLVPPAVAELIDSLGLYRNV